MYLQGFKYVSKAAYTEFLSSLSLYTTVTNVFTNLLSVTDICSFNSTIDFFDWECNLWCHLLRIVSCHVLPCLNFWWFYGVGGIASKQGPAVVANIFCLDSDGSVKAVTAKWSINMYYFDLFIHKRNQSSMFMDYFPVTAEQKISGYYL